MLYQLPDGRTVEISLEAYLEASDDDLKALLGMNYGIVLNNPSYGSAITKPGRKSDPDSYAGHDIPDVPSEEKLKDQDYSADDG